MSLADLSQYLVGYAFFSAQLSCEYLYRVRDAVLGDPLATVTASTAFLPAGSLVVVTGANTGIGLEIARDLARRGFRVLMACRSAERANKAIGDIKATVPDAQLEFAPLDLSSFASVRKFAAEFRARKEPLPLLINNAGMLPFDGARRVTDDGFELTLQSNYLGHFLLTHELLPALRAVDGEARVVNVASVAHCPGKISFDDVNYEKAKFDIFPVYAQTKLAQIMQSSEMQKRLDKVPGNNIKICSAHPGFVASTLYTDLHWLVRAALGVLAKLAIQRSSAEGARYILYPCLASTDVGGKYYADGREYTTAPQARIESDWEKLYRKTCEWTKVDSKYVLKA